MQKCFLQFSLSVMSDSFVTPQTIAHQTPLSVGFSRQDYWRELPFPSPGDLPNKKKKPISLCQLHYMWTLNYWATGETHKGILLGQKKDEIMPFAATSMDLENIILSKVIQRKTNIISLVCEISKSNTNKSIYKTETGSQTYNTNWWLQKGRVMEG